MTRSLREVAETVITAAIIFVVLQGATQTFRVVGPSMNPTLGDGQHLFVNKAVYASVGSDVLADSLPWMDDTRAGERHFLFHGPQHGDIIVFHPPSGEDADFVKRVVGVPGDVIDVRDGKVWVNGVVQNGDAHTSSRGGTLDYPLTVPPDRYFVLGDNRPASNDSRSWGFVHADQIVGKVAVRYWPFSVFRIF